MGSKLEFVVAAATVVTRLSAFCFLRWIPGHHFPPIIVSSTILYLALVFGFSDSFGAGRPSLHEVFPKLFKHEKQERAQEETAHDEPALYHDEKTILKTLLLGIPNWHEWEFSYITIGLNILVTLLSLDLVFRGPMLYNGKDLKFARVGYVDENSARVLFRDPNSRNLPIYAYLKASDHSTWTTTDTIYYLGEETDYTRPLTFSKLQSDTAYTYALSNDLQGSFKTASAPNSQKARSLTFLTSSCIKANFPYNPFAHSLSIAGFKHLSNVMRSIPSPASFMLFLGDFIYVDVPLRLGLTQEHYRSEYRRVYSSPSWKLPGVNLPWIHTLDDHEIANDWSGGNDTEPFVSASDPFMHYHVSVNPPLPPSVPSGPEANSTYFQFTQGPASFFMLDTRRYRTHPEESKSIDTAKPLYGSSSTPSQTPNYAPSMLGPVQLKALLAFLKAPEHPNVHWKIVASSVPFTKNWRFGTSDTWGGFLSERKQILEAMHYAEEMLGVRIVILSGDRHEFAAIRFPPPTSGSQTGTSAHEDTPGLGPHEFSVGPLSMFYLPIRSFKQIDNEDVALAYFPDGNSKLGVISIKPAGNPGLGESPASVLKYNLWVDGQMIWKYTITSPATNVRRTGNLETWRNWPI